ncbi:MAG: hypothetical protein U9R54_06580, partial [Bacteroidota bacterium]|nr:hypothetical protein [Bacteroidota bacterium]
ILPFSYDDIQNIRITGDNLYYHSSYSGIDNIYLHKINTSENYKITQSKYGIEDFDINENSDALLLSEHSSQGEKIVQAEINSNNFEDKNITNTRKLVFEELIDATKTKTSPINYDSIDYKQYKIKSFRRWQHLFNFHSWLPFYFDYEDYSTDMSMYNTTDISNDLAPGLMLISQNKISTASSILGYGYKNGNHKIYTSLVYKGLYPEIRISSDYGEMPTVVSSSSDWLPPIKSDATNLSIETLLPLNFTTASNIIYFQPSLKYTYNNSYYYNYTNDYFIRGLQMMRYRLYFGAYKFKAKRDIQPKFGFITDMNLINTPFEDELFGSIFYSSSVVFLPGLFKNHGIKLTGKYQEQNPTRYFYNTQLDFPRGFENSFTEKLFISKIDYVLPIIYPDLSLWPVLYLKRIKADLFFDYAQNQFRYKQGNTGNILWAKDNLYSIGCEITADYHFLKIQFPFETGIRYSFLPETNTSKIEAIFSINLY